MVSESKVKQLYASARWRTYTAPAVVRANPICQRIVDGIQCKNPSTIVHHLKSPKTAPELFTNWNNLVACCSEHHPGGLPGTDESYVWTHTIGLLKAVYYHSGGWPSWRPEWKPTTESERKLIATGATFSTVSTDALDAALLEPI